MFDPIKMNKIINQSVKGLYKELTPDIEAQVEAIEQEKARLNKSLDYVREELEKVDVTGQAAENLLATQNALERAKAQVQSVHLYVIRCYGIYVYIPVYVTVLI